MSDDQSFGEKMFRRIAYRTSNDVASAATGSPTLYVLSEDEAQQRAKAWGFSWWDRQRARFDMESLSWIGGGGGYEYMGWAARFSKMSGRGLIMVQDMTFPDVTRTRPIVCKLRGVRGRVILLADDPGAVMAALRALVGGEHVQIDPDGSVHLDWDAATAQSPTASSPLSTAGATARGSTSSAGPSVYVLSVDETRIHAQLWGFMPRDIRLSHFTSEDVLHVAGSGLLDLNERAYTKLVDRFNKAATRGLVIVSGRDLAEMPRTDVREILRTLGRVRGRVVLVDDIAFERQAIRDMFPQVVKGPVRCDPDGPVRFDWGNVVGTRTRGVPTVSAPSPERAEKVRSGLRDLNMAWLDYTLDPQRMFLDMPRLRDDGFPATRSYRAAMAVLGDTIDAINMRPTEEQVVAAEHALVAAEQAWSDAQTAATAAGVASLPPREQAALRRAHHHLTVLEDPTLPKAMREDRLRQLRMELDRLDTVPMSFETAMAMPQLDRVRQLAIEQGP